MFHSQGQQGIGEGIHARVVPLLRQTRIFWCIYHQKPPHYYTASQYILCYFQKASNHISVSTPRRTLFAVCYLLKLDTYHRVSPVSTSLDSRQWWYQKDFVCHCTQEKNVSLGNSHTTVQAHLGENPLVLVSRFTKRANIHVVNSFLLFPMFPVSRIGFRETLHSVLAKPLSFIEKNRMQSGAWATKMKSSVTKVKVLYD